MKCPHCKKDVILPNRALHNVEAYLKPARTITECCGNIVTVTPSVKLRVDATSVTEDDWGFKKGEI